MIEKAFQRKGISPRGVAWLSMKSTRSMIASIQDHETLIVFERERSHPDECEIGRIRLDAEGTYSLLQICPNAEWELDDRIDRYENATQISFGGEYERTLAMIADASPPAGG